MNDADPLVSIVIVTWNGRKYLGESIPSLLNQTWQKNEIILVDNASIDGSVEYVRKEFPSVKIMQNSENLGFVKAVNIGICAASGEMIAIFNDDAVADREWLSLLVKAIKDSPRAAASGGKIYYYRNGRSNDVVSTWSKIHPYTGGAWDFTDDEPASNVDYLPGSAMLVKKSVIDEIGHLDEKYFIYFEEVDWCARMIRAGYDLLYVPEAVVWHVLTASTASSTKAYNMVRNRVRFALKNFDRAYVPGFVLFFLVEIVYTFIWDLLRNLSETWIRIKSLWWNIANLRETFLARQRDFSRMKKRRSYNKSLPLREHWVGGAFDRFLRRGKSS